VSHDNPKAVTQAFGFDGASLDARVKNTKQLQDEDIAPGAGHFNPIPTVS